MEQQTQPTPKPTPTTVKKKAETKVLKANLNKDFEINPDEAHLIHFFATDYSAPKEKDVTKNQQPLRKLHKYTHADFLNAFKWNYIQNEWYTREEVNTAEKLYNILKSMDIEEVRDRRFEDLQKAKGRSDKERMEKQFLHDFTTLRNVGGNFMVVRLEDIIHLPKETN